MSGDGLSALRRHVHADPLLAQRLAAVDDAALNDEVLALARTLGVEVTADDLASATAAAQRDWLARWIR